MAYLCEACDQIRSPKGEVVYCFTSVRPSFQNIFRHIFLSNYWWHKSDIWSQASYRYPTSWEAFLDPSDSYFLFTDLVDLKNQPSRQTESRNLMGPKTLPTIWDTDMKLVTKYQICVTNRCWEKCDEKCAYNIYAHFSSHFSQQLLMTGMWYLVTSFI
jgi:hypothetical protein